MAGESKTSRLPGFYEWTLDERRQAVVQRAELDETQHAALRDGGLQGALADTFIENAVGGFGLPLGIATNFTIGGRDVLIPMAVEESSVVAAASHGAKLARILGGFKTAYTASMMTGQIQLFTQRTDYDKVLTAHRQMILSYGNEGQDRLVERGGGVKDLTWRYIPELGSVVLYLHIDTCDAMGANVVNTICEKVASLCATLFDNCRVGLRILTNLCDRRLAKASCRIPASAFARHPMGGEEVLRRIEEAWLFAKYDVYRATTHNKGVMNGIDPVVIATGNDWRAVEAGAHAWAARSGTYQPLTSWKVDSDGHLFGTLEMPMALGTVGGVTKLHPASQAALKLLGQPSAGELAAIVCAVGLAQNLSALLALSTEGIQAGHMALHRKNIDLFQSQNMRSNEEQR